MCHKLTEKEKKIFLFRHKLEVNLLLIFLSKYEKTYLISLGISILLLGYI